MQEKINFEEPQKKVRDIEKERGKILDSVARFASENITSRVSLILNNFPDTRDSDIRLQIKYWEMFQPDLFNGTVIDVEDYPKLEHLSTITRARAFIQNTCGLFEASPDVQEQRGVLANEEKEKIRREKPDYPAITVYADESGKNDKTLIVGSVWLLNEKISYEFYQQFFAWKQQQGIRGEFHFRNITERNIDSYKQLVDMLNAKSGAMGFRAITVERAGISNVQDAFIRLYSQLLLRGIEFENETGRARLPRYIQFVKDKEEDGYDKLLLAEVRDRLISHSQSRFSGNLHVDFLRAEDSVQHPYLQLSDLLASSINRIYNQPGSGNNPKDEFATFFLNSFGITMNLTKLISDTDLSYHISL
jgi:hypothetical protein